MPYYLGKVPLRAELPELAEEVSAAISSPQEVQFRTLFWEGETDGGFGCSWCVEIRFMRVQGTLFTQTMSNGKKTVGGKM